MKKRLKDPFVLAFIFGLVFLTALPFLQRRFLSAPAPLGSWGEWSLPTLDQGTPFGSAELRGHVVMAAFAGDPCDAECVERIAALGRALQHTDDLGDSIHLLTVAMPAVADGFKGRAQPRWHLLTGSPEAMEGLFAHVRTAWGTFAGTDAGTAVDELARLPAYVVIDQQGQIRGFWRDDSAGRGNAINAARLLARQGPKP